MKARTAKERAVEAATARYIRPVDSAAVLEAARPEVFFSAPKNRGGGVWCANCGGRIDFNPELLINYMDGKPRVTCPHCGRKLSRARYMGAKLVMRDFDFACVAEAHGDYQLLRYFYVPETARMGQPVQFGEPIEVVRRWYDMARGGAPVVWSVGFTGICYKRLNLNAPLTLKKEGGGYYGANYRIGCWPLAGPLQNTNKILFEMF